MGLVLTEEKLGKMLDDAVDNKIGAAVEEALSKASKDTESPIFNVLRSSRANDSDEKATGKDLALQGARMVRCLAIGGDDKEKAARHACDKLADKTVEKMLTAGDYGSAGFILPQNVSSEFITLLRPKSVVRAAGARRLPMPGGSMDIPRWNSGVSGSYLGETAPTPVEGQDGGMLHLQEKELGVLVPVSKRLRDNADMDTDQFVLDDIIAGLASRENLAFLRDNGTQFTPRGMRFQAAAENVIPAATGGADHLADVRRTFQLLMEAIEGENIEMEIPAWFWTTRTKNHLRWSVSDGNGNLVFKEMSEGKLDGKPFHSSNAIPNTLGGGSDESEIMLADMSQCIIGESQQIEVQTSNEASYTDPSSGETMSAFQNRMFLMQATLRHDFAVRYNKAIAVATGVDWGA